MITSPRSFALSLCTGLAGALLLAVAGCGPDGVTGLDDAGGGTGTLLVSGTVVGEDTAPGTFQTEFTVTVSDANQAPVSDASVKVDTPDGSVTLTQTDTPGRYTASRDGYREGIYTLTVTRGLSDWVAGVVAIGPDVQEITAPAAGAVVVANQSLVIRWSRGWPAGEAVIESRDYVGAPERDDNESVIPPSGSPPRTDQRLRVTRTNRTLVAGGLPGSSFSVGIRNSIQPIIAQ